MNNKGQASILGFIAILMVGGSVAIPQAIDLIDFGPDNPTLYRIEKFAENGKRIVGVISDEELLDERLAEYEELASKGEHYPHVLIEAEMIRVRIIDENEKKLQKAMQTGDIGEQTSVLEKQKRLDVILSKHVQTLEQVKARAPEQAQKGISNAILKSSGVLEKHKIQQGRLIETIENKTGEKVIILMSKDGDFVVQVPGVEESVFDYLSRKILRKTTVPVTEKVNMSDFIPPEKQEVQKPDRVCKGLNSHCRANNECCSGKCEKKGKIKVNVCVQPSVMYIRANTCKGSNAHCIDDAECCSGICGKETDGRKISVCW